MARTYRIRDTQRFLFLPLLFPLLPLLVQMIHPPWTEALFVLEAFFIVFAFWMMFRTREMVIGEHALQIGQGFFAQTISHEQMYEIVLVKHNVIHIRMDGANRYLRISAVDSEAAAAELNRFAWRHAIPLIDRRPRGTGRASRGM